MRCLHDDDVNRLVVKMSNNGALFHKTTLMFLKTKTYLKHGRLDFQILRMQNHRTRCDGITCKLLNRVQMALSSSSTFRHTSPIIALSRKMASLVEVWSSFTTWKGRRSHGLSTIAVFF